MAEISERIHLQIRGRVQGVWFRVSAAEKARELGLTGWVRNLPGGPVELVAEGPPQAIERLLGWCREGPTLARVEEVGVERSPATGAFSSFEVR